MNIGLPDVLLPLIEPAVGKYRAVDVNHVIGKYLGCESLAVLFCGLENSGLLGFILEHIAEFIGSVHEGIIIDGTVATIFTGFR